MLENQTSAEPRTYAPGKQAPPFDDSQGQRLATVTGPSREVIALQNQ